jgi:hypothetical protein
MGLRHLTCSPQLVRHRCLAALSDLSIVVCDMNVCESDVARCTVRMYGRAAYTGMCIVVPVSPGCLCCGEQSVHGVRLAHAVTTPPPQPDVATS